MRCGLAEEEYRSTEQEMAACAGSACAGSAAETRKPEDRLTVALSWVHNTLQKTDVNWGQRSETTSTGRPWRREAGSPVQSPLPMGVWAGAQNGPSY